MSELPKGWVETRLGDVVTLVGGGTPKTTKSEYWNGDIPWISVVDFNSDDRWVSTTEKSITVYGLENSSTKLLDKGDLIISARGTVGALAQLKKPMAFNQSCYGIKEVLEISDQDFLFYLIKFSVKQIIKKTHGAVFDTITRQTFDNIQINLPPLSEQKAIAGVLSAFDDKIELLREQNKTLETLAQTIFKEWFVHFNFPDQNGKPYRDNGGEMVDSELGEIPKGWRVGKLKEITEKISKGTTPRKKEVEGLPVQVPFLKVKDISDGGLIKMDSLEQIPTVIHNGALSRSILKTNDILFSIAGTIGRMAIVPDDLNDANCNQAIAFIRLRSKNVFLEYAHQWLKSSEVQYKIKSSIVQGVQANVSLTVLGNLKVTIPNNEIMNKWNEIIKLIYGKIKNNTAQIQTLSKTRDTLLPKLMSGEIRVKGFEQ